VVVVGGVARHRLRAGRCRQVSVRILYRRTKQEMPCLLSGGGGRGEASKSVLMAPTQLGNSHHQLSLPASAVAENRLFRTRRPYPSKIDFQSPAPVIAAIGHPWKVSTDGLRYDWESPRQATGHQSVRRVRGRDVPSADLAVRAVAAGCTAAYRSQCLRANRLA
jgi:hypothetical protein